MKKCYALLPFVVNQTIVKKVFYLREPSLLLLLSENSFCRPSLPWTYVKEFQKRSSWTNTLLKTSTGSFPCEKEPVTSSRLLVSKRPVFSDLTRQLPRLGIHPSWTDDCREGGPSEDYTRFLILAALRMIEVSGFGSCADGHIR